MWDLPVPGLEPMFSALAGGLLTTEPPGKPPNVPFKSLCFLIFILYDLSVGESGALKSPTIIVLLSISLFLWLFAFALCIERLLCWMHKYLQWLYLLLGLIPLS